MGNRWCNESLVFCLATEAGWAASPPREDNLFGSLTMKTSARNAYAGTVSFVRDGAVNAEVGLKVRDGIELVAIVTRESVETLKITRDTTGASLLQPREEMHAVIGSNWTITSEVQVKMTTLDRLLADIPEVSLLKIDVQGYEKPVLAGARATLGKTKFLLIELNFMPQYDGGSWLGEIHQILTRDFGFFLANASAPQVLNGRASMCDGLYVNPHLVQEWVKPDFV